MATTLSQSRMTVRTISGLDIVAGLWLIAAPFFLGYSSIAAATANEVVIGIAVVLLASLRETRQGYKTAWPSWVNSILGLWLIIAPFALGYSFVTNAMWNSVITGIVIAVLAAWSALATPREEDMR